MKKSRDEILKELAVAQYMCNNDSLFFTRYFYRKRFNKKFVVNPHHRILCDALNRVTRGECKKLIINIAPRYSKTELAVINFISRGLGINPQSKYIHLSYSDDLALENSEAIRDIVTMPEYMQIYGYVDIKKDSRAKKSWKINKGGAVYATSTGGQVTGFGSGLVDDDNYEYYLDESGKQFEEEFVSDIDEVLEGINEFGGGLVIDDAIKPEDADVDLIREKINKRYDSTIKNRVNSRNTPIIIIGQRTHPDDLPGYIMRNPDHGYEVISLPCILRNDDLDKVYSYVDDDGISHKDTLRGIYNKHYIDTIHEIENTKKTVKNQHIIESIKILIKNIQSLDAEISLWPFKHTLKELYKDLSEDKITFERQYLQNPQPLSGLMYPKPFMTYVELPENLGIIKSQTDIADDGTCYLCSIKYVDDGVLKYVLDIIYTQEPTEKTEPLCVELNKDVNYANFESNNGGKSFARNIERMSRKVDNWKTSFNWYFEHDNKDARIRSGSSTVQNCIVFPHNWHIRWPLFYQHVTRYSLTGKNKYKDGPDVLTAMIEKQPYGDNWATIT